MTVHWPSHPHVPHPSHLLPISRFNDWVAGRLTRILGSAIFFYICFTVPLAVLPGPTWAKTLVNILSSAWIQLWALAVLQMGQNKADDMRKAMAEATYRALTHVATVGDATNADVEQLRTDVVAIKGFLELTFAKPKDGA